MFYVKMQYNNLIISNYSLYLFFDSGAKIKKKREGGAAQSQSAFFDTYISVYLSLLPALF